MKIDNYITHLELRRKALRKKCTDLLLASDKIKLKKNTIDPNFDEINKLRNEIREINNKLVFLLKLKKGVINESNRVQESTGKTRC